MEHLREEFHQAISEYMTDLDDENIVMIAGDKITPLEILKELRNDTYNLAFSDWLSEREQLNIETANQILKNDNLKGRFSKLQELYQTNSLVPFVGAGMSVPTGYKSWTAFLYQLHAETNIPRHEFETLLTHGKYEEAAEALAQDLTPREFAERLENAFPPPKDIEGPVQLLPHYFDGLVVTTNFDEVLEVCFEDSEKRFDSILCGPDPRLLRKHLSRGKRVLMKLHGSVDDDRNRILTSSEYNRYYDEANTLDFCLACLTDSPLLFLGCSLFTDRTLQTMKKLTQAPTAIDPVRHYAFLPHPGKGQERNRTRFLAEANIFPIWYDLNEYGHDEAIEALLCKLCTEQA